MTRLDYAADRFAGAIPEILAHTLRPRTLPGPHHGVRIEIPESVAVETLDPAALPGWDERGSAAARDFGDGWFDERRSAVLLVPALPSRPNGRTAGRTETADPR